MKLSVTSPTSQLILILQAFCHFTYVTAHSPTLPWLYLRHNSFSNPLLLLLCHRFSLTSPGEPPMKSQWHAGGSGDRVTRRLAFERHVLLFWSCPSFLVLSFCFGHVVLFLALSSCPPGIGIFTKMSDILKNSIQNATIHITLFFNCLCMILLF